MDEYGLDIDSRLQEEKPHSIMCSECGDPMPPTQIGDQWLPPTDPCDECDSKKQRKERLKQAKRETFEARWTDAVESIRHRKSIKGVDLHPRLQGLLGAKGDLECGVYIWGAAGTGKSTQCVAACREYLRQTISEADSLGAMNVRAQWSTEAEICNEIRESYGSDSIRTADVLDRYRYADFLALDDIGTANPSGDVVEKLELILDCRYRQCLPTLFASNASLHELSELTAYDDRFISRVFEMCGLSVADDGAIVGDGIMEFTTNYRRGGQP